MKQLPVPVREVLDETMDEAATQRIWREVGRRRVRRAEARPARIPRWTLAVAAAFALVLLVVWKGPRFGTPDDPAPLRLAGGAELALPSPAADGATARFVAMDDGSRVTVFPGARLAVLENSGRQLTFLLEGGRARFEITPGGPRRWTIECGVLSVEVAGTRFEVERTATSARVVVEEGVVLVRGEGVRDRVQRLGAGESVEVSAAAAAQGSAGAEPPATAVAAAADSASAAGPAAGASASASAGAPGERPAPGAWRELARRGAYAEAYGVLGREGIAEESRRATLDELMQLADVARLSNHPADAVAPLARVVAEHRGDSRCSMAAFTLGRLRLDQLGQAAGAASAFADAIALGLPAGLVEDAHARLVEARARAGDRAGAAIAAAEYERRFPNGRRLAAVRAWAAAP
jgi:transmembrane sensor